MLLDAFYPYVLPEVLGCPDPLVSQALRLAATEFCRGSLAWSEIQGPYPLIEGVRDYEMDTPVADAVVASVQQVWVDDKSLTAMPVDSAVPGSAIKGMPTHFTMSFDASVVSLYPLPSDAAMTLTARVAYAPSMSATTLPDFLGVEWVEVIASGAKARLMTMPKTDWTNPELGLYYRQIFDKGVQSARITDAYGRVPGAIKVKPKAFGY